MVSSSLAPRLGLALVSTLVALGGAWYVLGIEGEQESSIEFVDDAEAARAALIERMEGAQDGNEDAPDATAGPGANEHSAQASEAGEGDVASVADPDEPGDGSGDGVETPVDPELAPDQEVTTPVVVESPAELGLEFARRLREDLTDEDRAILFPQLERGSNRPVPGVHFGLLPNKRWKRRFAEHPDGGFKRHTNSLGMREDTNPSEGTEGFCVLVMGDSHTEGVCANSESLANQFEAGLRADRPTEQVDVWNVAVGGYSPTNYLGTLDAYGHLQPDAVVLVFYGGNDFRESLYPWRYLYRRPPGIHSKVDITPLLEGPKQGVAMLGQEINQALAFAADPAAGQDALRLALACGIELDRQCRERGARFLFVYLPPPSIGQADRYRERVRAGLATLGGDPDALEFCDGLADETLQGLEQAGVATLDLRPSFASADEPLYWNADLHLNLDGHALVGQLVHKRFNALPER